LFHFIPKGVWEKVDWAALSFCVPGMNSMLFYARAARLYKSPTKRKGEKSKTGDIENKRLPQKTTSVNFIDAQRKEEGQKHWHKYKI